VSDLFAEDGPFDLAKGLEGAAKRMQGANRALPVIHGYMRDNGLHYVRTMDVVACLEMAAGKDEQLQRALAPLIDKLKAKL
jgi:hypothetical protein